jgi:hypothetical protein
MDLFLQKLDTLLNNIATSNKRAFITLDTNTNLLLKNQLSKGYLDAIIPNGFLPIITKATRISGISYSLIDHILTNVKPNGIGLSGTIVGDLSDHFINFTEIIHNFNTTKKIETVTKRAITNENVDRFKMALQQLRWETVLNKQTVDEAFDEFSNIFNDLYNINFPTMHFKFNKNIHKINDFMTTGLLISRQTKTAQNSCNQQTT